MEIKIAFITHQIGKTPKKKKKASIWQSYGKFSHDGNKNSYNLYEGEFDSNQKKLHIYLLFGPEIPFQESLSKTHMAYKMPGDSHPESKASGHQPGTGRINDGAARTQRWEP